MEIGRIGRELGGYIGIFVFGYFMGWFVRNVALVVQLVLDVIF